MKTNSKSCSTCAFWVEPEVSENGRATEHGSQQDGECRANPPVPVVDVNGVVTVWPKTDPRHWCGSWRYDRQKEQAEEQHVREERVREELAQEERAREERAPEERARHYRTHVLDFNNESLYTMISDRHRGLEWGQISQNFGISPVQLATLRRSYAWRDEAESYINATPDLSHDERTYTDLGCL